MRPSTDNLGVYLSVPFCRAKCTFCNFASGVGTAEAVQGYVDLLCREMHSVRRCAEAAELDLPQGIDTVYLGGGTPSLLEPAQMEAVFAALRREFDILPDAEITMEAAPGQIEGGLLEAALRCGVNRVSLGVQTFADEEARAVGRSHSERSCREEFTRLRGAGVRNLGVDLIAGLPLQTEGSWERSLEVALESELDHLSVYMLEIDEESRLGREVLGGGARLQAPAVPTDDSIADMYAMACQRLPEAGFRQYEISNFAKNGCTSSHNLKYWLRKPYLGFGLDAHSMAFHRDGTARRWANAEELAGYKGTSCLDEGRAVSEREAYEETVFLTLRLAEGLADEALHGFPTQWREHFVEQARLLQAGGLLCGNHGCWQLTERGRLVSSEVFGELLAA